MSTNSSPGSEPGGPEDGSPAGGDPLDWAQRLAAIAQTGLTYGEGVYDRQRYAQVRDIAAQMLAQLSGADAPTIASALAVDGGYATPKLDTRAIVVRDGALLLVRERSDGRWAPPGGFVDVGEGPRAAVERETLEESGFAVRVDRLLAVFDRNQHPHEPGLHHIWKLFFACELVGGAAAASIETSEVGFFAPDGLPELSLTRVTPSQVDLALRLHATRGAAVHVD